MKIVVPSYNRATLCITQHIISPVEVVVPMSQRLDYIENIESDKCHIVCIPDEKDWNIAKKRNAMLDMYEDEDIVMLDDDIKWFAKLRIEELHKMTESEILTMLTKTFESMERLGLYLWGVYPVCNAFFMNHTIATKGFIIGSTMLFRKWHWLRFDETLKAKEDYDISLQAYYKHWAVYRLNDIATAKQAYKGKGWVAQQRTESDIDWQAVQRMLEKRPNDVRANPKRDNEILIK